MEVRVAKPQEYAAVLDFYTRMIDEMRGTDFDVQWKHGVHPSPEFLRASVDAGRVYLGVVEGDEVVSSAGAQLDEPAEGADTPGASGVLDTPDVSDAPNAAPRPAIACALVMNDETAPGYETVSWRVDAPPADVWVLHVVATLPAYHGRGYAYQLVSAAVEAARAAGKKSLRLDTFDFNDRARRLYEKCGFDFVGTATTFYKDIGNIDAAMYEHVL